MGSVDDAVISEVRGVVVAFLFVHLLRISRSLSRERRTSTILNHRDVYYQDNLWIVHTVVGFPSVTFATLLVRFVMSCLSIF